jgi:hypothetical protein
METLSRLAALLLFAAATAWAQEAAKGEAIQAAISGNTVQGDMHATGIFIEFYANGGTIRGKDYTGA